MVFFLILFPLNFFSLSELLICTVHRRKRIHFRLCRSGMRRRFRREDKNKNLHLRFHSLFLFMLNTYLASRCLLLARRSRKHSSHKRGRESATFPLAPRQNKKPPIRWSRTTDSIRIKNINTQLLSASCFVSFSIPNFHRHDAHGCRAVDRSGGNFRTAPSCSRHGSCRSLDYDRTGSAMNIKADGGYISCLGVLGCNVLKVALHSALVSTAAAVRVIEV